MERDSSKSYRTTLQILRAPASLCNSTAVGSTSYDEVVVPRHQLVSALETEAVLPFGCWAIMYAVVRSEHSGIASYFLLTNALPVR